MKIQLLAWAAALSLSLTCISSAQNESEPVLLARSCPAFTAQIATRLGAKVINADGPITADQLAGVRLLAIMAPRDPFSEAEGTAIRNFVTQGGSLLVVVDEDRRQPRAREIANPLLTPFGLEFTADVPYIHNVGAVAAPGAINPQTREIPYSGGRAVTGGTPFSLIQDTERLAHAAYVELPSGGRVVAMGDAMVALGLGKPEGARRSGVPNDPSKTTYWGKDSALFMEEVLTWLLAKR